MVYSINTNYGKDNIFSNNQISSANVGKTSSNQPFSETRDKYKYGQNTAAYYSPAAQSYLTNLKTNGDSFKSSANAISNSSSSSAFKQTTSTSQNADVVTAKTDPKSTNNALLKPIDVTVDQVATKQKNQGLSQTATAATTLTAASTQQFEIETGGKKQQFSFNVSSTDTNRSIQQKMADEINKKAIGVQASVAYDAVTNKSSLVLESKETGTTTAEGKDNSFAIRDVSGKAVAESGVSNVTQQVQDAHYKVNNGPEITSKTNNVDLGNGVTATLKQASNQSVQLSFQQDSKSIVNAAKQFVDNYNKLLTTAQDNSTDAGAGRLTSELTSLSRAYRAPLSRSGIEVGANGRLSINSSLLEQAAKDGSLEKTFNGGANGTSGLGSSFAKIAEKVTKSPTSYVTPTAKTPVNNYSNFNPLNFNPVNYNSMNYNFNGFANFNNYSSIGMMFSSYY